MTRHFLDIAEVPPAVPPQLVQQGLRMKAKPKLGRGWLADKVVAMIFEKPSTRTRTSFEVGICQLGGHPMVLKSDDMQLGRGETIADTARVLAGYADAIMIRCSHHETLTELADYSSVPVINGLTDRSHPCQVMADVMTMAEQAGSLEAIKDWKVAWFGDGNNVAVSWIEAAAVFGFTLCLATPPALRPPAEVIEAARASGAKLQLTDDAAEAADAAAVMVTDTWSSMGMPGGYSNSGDRQQLLRPFQINSRIMARALPDAFFMHCLPVYRGQEATADVVDGPQSVIWQEANNRLHVQKAILAWALAAID